MGIQKLVILILGQIVVEVGVDCIEHLVDDCLLNIGLESENGLEELLLGDLSFVGMVGHAEDVPEDHPHFLGSAVKVIDRVDEGVGLVLVGGGRNGAN